MKGEAVGPGTSASSTASCHRACRSANAASTGSGGTAVRLPAHHASSRAVKAPRLVAIVRAGATFINGKLVEQPGDNAQLEATGHDPPVGSGSASHRAHRLLHRAIGGRLEHAAPECAGRSRAGYRLR